VFLWSDKTNHATTRNEDYVENVLEEFSQYLAKIPEVKIALILDGGTSASAARFRVLASRRRQCSEEVAIARSNSRRYNREVRKVSAPVPNN
jgi:hypothetical protein